MNVDKISRTTGGRSYGSRYLLDGVPYHTLDMKNIPAGYAGVDVSTDQHGPCKMVAGHVAAAASVSPAPVLSSSSPPSSLQPHPEAVEQAHYDTLSPAPQWFFYVKAETPRWGYEEEQAKRMKEWRKKWEERKNSGVST